MSDLDDLRLGKNLPPYKNASAYLKSRLNSSSKVEVRTVRTALSQLEEMKVGTKDEQAAAWYYLTFCQGWGYAIRRDRSICMRRGWLAPRDLAYYLGLNGEQPHYLAIRPSRCTAWVAIDIDIGSKYHPGGTEGMGGVKEALASIGLRSPIEFQSSASCGMHLWYPLNCLAGCWMVASTIESALIKYGLLIKNGVLELRPNRKCQGSDYQLIRAPLTGEENGFVAPGYREFGFHENLQYFHALWVKMQKHNDILVRYPCDLQALGSSPNTRRPFECKGKLAAAKQRLKQGFSAPGQSQELKLCALQIARFVEQIDQINALKNRVYELIKTAPGYLKFCGHQDEINRHIYLTDGELLKALQMPLGGYKGTWREQSNQRRSQEASERALEAIEMAKAQGLYFYSLNKALRYLNNAGAPSLSWWKKPSNLLLKTVVQVELVMPVLKG